MRETAVKKIVIFLLCITFVIAAGFAKVPEANVPLKIAINTWPGYAHAYIAQEKGYFKKNGVNVELVQNSDYVANTKYYTNQGADGIFEVFADAILQNSEGISSCVVYVSDYSVTGDVIIGRPELKGLADLKLRKVGIEGINTFSHLFVFTLLEKAGIKEEEMRFEIIPANEVVNALKSGKIDAGHTYEPTKTKALQMGYKILGSAGDTPGIITDVLVFKESVIKNRPREIKAVVQSLLEAQDFVVAHKEEAIKIMAKNENMSEEEIQNGLKGLHLLDLKENIKFMKKVDEPSTLFGSGKRIIDFYLKRGQLVLLPDLDKVIEPKFLEELGK